MMMGKAVSILTAVLAMGAVAANVCALHQEVGIGVNVGAPHLTGFEVKYLLAHRHQLHLSYLSPAMRGPYMGLKTDLSLGYTYRFRKEGFYPILGMQVRYWRFDLDDSIYPLMEFLFLLPLFLLTDAEIGEMDRHPTTDVVFCGPQFGLERRRGHSALSFDLEILGYPVYIKHEGKGSSLEPHRLFLSPYFSVRYTYYF